MGDFIGPFFDKDHPYSERALHFFLDFLYLVLMTKCLLQKEITAMSFFNRICCLLLLETSARKLLHMDRHMVFQLIDRSSITEIIADALVEFTHSTVYDNYDFIGVKEVNLPSNPFSREIP